MGSMVKYNCWILVLILSACICLGMKPDVEKAIVDFSLLNVNGKYLSLKDYPDAKGFMIVFTCNHCPFAKLYPPRLNKLNSKYQPLGVPLFAISSTDTLLYEEDMYPQMKLKAKSEKFNFPYLYDGTQQVAKAFGAQKTPHAFLVWKEKDQWVVKYSGAIDDNGMEPKLVQNRYLSNAVDAMLSGETIQEKETRSIGCQIMFRK